MYVYIYIYIYIYVSYTSFPIRCAKHRDVVFKARQIMVGPRVFSCTDSSVG